MDSLYKSKLLFGTLIASAMIMVSAPVFADAIDGHWCNEKNTARLWINGPTIVTPAGNRLIGDYGRHDFAYVIPKGETGSGTTNFLVLQDEDTLILNRPTEAGKSETWRRCGPPTS